MSVTNLPAPIITGGKQLMEILKERASCKSYTDRSLDDQQLSNLLWAAFGINRAESGKRTAASARNIQEMKLFLILEKGVYYYDPAANALEQTSDKDLRQISSAQPIFFNAPLHLVYVADYEGQDIPPEKSERYNFYSHAHAGLIGQNVYLYCASEGLGTCFIANFDKDGLHKSLKLNENQIITYVQVVGHPA